MYKGNMYEFVDKVSEYVMEKKNRLITFRINDNPWLFKGEYYYICCLKIHPHIERECALQFLNTSYFL